MNPMRRCGCQACRRGMRGPCKAIVRRAVRSFRRQCKAALKKGLEPDKLFQVPYTD